jgi:hypothetical protein
MSTPEKKEQNEEYAVTDKNILAWMLIVLMAFMPYAILLGLLLYKVGHASPTVSITIPIILLFILLANSYSTRNS